MLSLSSPDKEYCVSQRLWIRQVNMTDVRLFRKRLLNKKSVCLFRTVLRVRTWRMQISCMFISRYPLARDTWAFKNIFTNSVTSFSAAHQIHYSYFVLSYCFSTHRTCLQSVSNQLTLSPTPFSVSFGHS